MAGVCGGVPQGPKLIESARPQQRAPSHNNTIALQGAPQDPEQTLVKSVNILLSWQVLKRFV